METEPATLAIVVPAFNSAETIRETLVSIQEQTSLNRISAVYVADDASSDNSSGVARLCWSSKVPLIITRNERNLGERATVNRVVGELPETVTWFLILHADDLAKPDWVEVMARESDYAAPAVITLTASYDVLGEDGSTAKGEDLGLAAKVLIEGTPESIRDTLKRGCWFKISSCAIQKTAFLALGGFRADMPQLGDWEFTLRALQARWSIEYIPLRLSVYRQTRQSVSSRSFREHRDVQEALRVLREFGSYLSWGALVRRYLFFLSSLLRRSARSLLTGDFARLKRAFLVGIEVGVEVSHALMRSLVEGNGEAGSPRELK